MKEQNIMRLYRIPLSSDAASPFGDLSPVIYAQILICVSRLPAVCTLAAKLHTGSFFPGTNIDILGVVELFQDAIVAPPFNIQGRLCSYCRVERSHAIRIVTMRLNQTKVVPCKLSCRAVSDAYLHGRDRLHGVVDVPFHGVHERRTLVCWEFLIITVKLAARLVVLWRMAFFTASGEFR